MKHLPFKRHLTFLALGLLIIGVMVPLATFAKSSAQQPSAVQTSVVQPNWSVATAVTVTTDCRKVVFPTPGRQVIGTFTANHEVQGSGVMTSGDPTEVNEEAIALIETNGSFTKLIFATGVAQNFHFTVHVNGDKLTACFANIGPDDELDTTPGNTSDHTGSITFQVRQL